MWVLLLFPSFLKKKLKNGGYADVVHCAEGLNMLVKPFPAYWEHLPGFWMKALLPGSVFNIKFGINLWSQGKELALLTTAASAPKPGVHASTTAPGWVWAPFRVIVPLTPGWNDPSTFFHSSPAKSPSSDQPACPSLSPPNDMGNVGVCVFQKKNCPVHVLFTLSRWPLSQAVKPHLIYSLLLWILISTVRIKTLSQPTMAKARCGGTMGTNSSENLNPPRITDSILVNHPKGKAQARPVFDLLWPLTGS